MSTLGHPWAVRCDPVIVFTKTKGLGSSGANGDVLCFYSVVITYFKLIREHGRIEQKRYAAKSCWKEVKTKTQKIGTHTTYFCKRKKQPVSRSKTVGRGHNMSNEKDR